MEKRKPGRPRMVVTRSEVEMAVNFVLGKTSAPEILRISEATSAHQWAASRIVAGVREGWVGFVR